ncbi:mechanosensitive ion channel domain-containing protein [Leptolyngbya sp. BC1307]|uniref:mechanosensitive ion channel family protein n=1 Tax=Leptolyngbya sp. BC1307 TaxID=2029589 RepID=UPI000EFCEA5A|nr:mechanosensitive ion channel domain-containing protein [Leptolyngbya sp. BC1307]
MLGAALGGFGEAELELGLVVLLTVGITAIAFRVAPAIFRAAFDRLSWPKTIYTEVIEPQQTLLAIALGLSAVDLLITLLEPGAKFYSLVDIPLSLAVSGLVIWLSFRLSKLFFDVYLLNAAVREGTKINSEILLLGKVTATAGGVVTVVLVFGQTHQVNVVGLIASLGVGGLALAFAAQKTLEQILGSIVLYVDRPFVIDDYIGLPDGTFGQVESIGLRSTKIRTSGKGTLVVAPNNMLTQIPIENFTDAKKVMSIIYLQFHRAIASDEKALIRQVILESTQSIFGIDSRSTDITFMDTDNAIETRAQITFFILGSGEVSMDLRGQLLDIASLNIAQRLKEFGIAFDIEEQRINVDSPITI